jgi:hypothetical protein
MVGRTYFGLLLLSAWQNARQTTIVLASAAKSAVELLPLVVGTPLLSATHHPEWNIV